MNWMLGPSRAFSHIDEVICVERKRDGIFCAFMPAENFKKGVFGELQTSYCQRQTSAEVHRRNKAINHGFSRNLVEHIERRSSSIS